MTKPEFKLLSDFEHIKMRPGMYIGSTSLETIERFVFGEMKQIEYVPGLVKIIEEIIDNSVDEAIRTKFKNGCDIDVVLGDDYVLVSDNGNGIPVKNVITPEGETIPQAVAAWTRTKAGSNFTDTGDQIGMNGVGSSLTNAFSSQFIGKSCDGVDLITVECSEGGTKQNWKKSKSRSKGTSVQFWPDFTHFGCSSITQEVKDLIKDRLIGLSMVFPKLNITFNTERINSTFRQYVKMYTPDPEIPTVLQENENCSIGLTTSEEGFRVVSYVNGLHTKNGGSQVDVVMDEITTLMIPIIKRRHKVDVTKARIRECLTLILVIRNLKGMKFDSQTKERLTNTWGEVKNHINVDYQKLVNAIMAKEELYMPIIESAVAKQLAAEKAATTRAQNQAKRAKVAKHIKANKIGTKADTTLFLLEGNSAAGFLLMTRDQDLHGGLPLRGKVKNTWGDTPANIIKNKELFDIMAITGLRFDSDGTDIQYQNIAIMVDADKDGQGSIYPTLLAFFSRWPKLFDQGRIRFLKTPIIICTDKKTNQQEWFYTVQDYESKRSTMKPHDFRYIKGLGSLEVDEYRRVIQEPVYDIVKLDKDYSDIFDLLYGSDTEIRKEWMSTGKIPRDENGKI